MQTDRQTDRQIDRQTCARFLSPHLDRHRFRDALELPARYELRYRAPQVGRGFQVLLVRRGRYGSGQGVRPAAGIVEKGRYPLQHGVCLPFRLSNRGGEGGRVRGRS